MNNPISGVVELVKKYPIPSLIALVVVVVLGYIAYKKSGGTVAASQSGDMPRNQTASNFSGGGGGGNSPSPASNAPGVPAPISNAPIAPISTTIPGATVKPATPTPGNPLTLIFPNRTVSLFDTGEKKIQFANRTVTQDTKGKTTVFANRTVFIDPNGSKTVTWNNGKVRHVPSVANSNTQSEPVSNIPAKGMSGVVANALSSGNDFQTGV